MKAFLGTALAAAFLLSALPTAQAQDVPGLALSLAVDDLATPIPYSGSGTLSFNITVGCLAALRSMSESTTTSATATVDLANAPSSVTAHPPAAAGTSR